MTRHWFRVAASLLLLIAGAGLAEGPQPVLTVSDEEVITAAWAPDSGRVAYALYRTKQVREKKFRRDELWVVDLAGKKKRLVEPDEIWPPRQPGGYEITHIAWSPDGSKLAVEATSSAQQTVFFLFDERGKCVRIGEGASFAPGYFAAWMGDNETVAYLTEALKPRLLFEFQIVRPRAGTGHRIFERKLAAAAAWQPRGMKVAFIERDRELEQTPPLVIGDLANGQTVASAELRDGFAGGLRFTPDGERIAYFVGGRQLEVRRLSALEQAERYRLPLSRFEFSPDAATLFYLEPERPATTRGPLTRLILGSRATEKIFGERLVDDFWISPDGKLLATLEGELRPALKVYRLAP